MRFTVILGSTRDRAARGIRLGGSCGESALVRVYDKLHGCSCDGAVILSGGIGQSLPQVCRDEPQAIRATPATPGRGGNAVSEREGGVLLLMRLQVRVTMPLSHHVKVSQSYESGSGWTVHSVHRGRAVLGVRARVRVRARHTDTRRPWRRSGAQSSSMREADAPRRARRRSVPAHSGGLELASGA